MAGRLACSRKSRHTDTRTHTHVCAPCSHPCVCPVLSLAACAAGGGAAAAATAGAAAAAAQPQRGLLWGIRGRGSTGRGCRGPAGGRGCCLPRHNANRTPVPACPVCGARERAVDASAVASCCTGTCRIHTCMPLPALSPHATAPFAGSPVLQHDTLMPPCTPQ